jgi:hypothetical protein
MQCLPNWKGLFQESFSSGPQFTVVSPLVHLSNCQMLPKKTNPQLYKFYLKIEFKLKNSTQTFFRWFKKLSSKIFFVPVFTLKQTVGEPSIYFDNEKLERIQAVLQTHGSEVSIAKIKKLQTYCLTKGVELDVVNIPESIVANSPVDLGESIVANIPANVTESVAENINYGPVIIQVTMMLVFLLPAMGPALAPFTPPIIWNAIWGPAGIWFTGNFIPPVSIWVSGNPVGTVIIRADVLREMLVMMNEQNDQNIQVMEQVIALLMRSMM